MAKTKGELGVHIRFFNIVEPVSPIYRDLIPYLANRGASIDIFISSKEYRPGRPALESEIEDPKIRIWRVGAGSFTGKGKLAKLWAMLAYGASAALRSLVYGRADLNFFLTQPPFFSLWGYLLKVLRGEKYLCLVMDVYPEVAIGDGLLAEGSLLTQALQKLSSFSLRQASAVIVIGRCMAELIRKKGVRPELIHFIPNWINAKDVYPILHSENPMRQELGLGDDFVVLYSGNIGVSHYFDDLLDVAKRCRAHLDLKFVIVGDGVRRKEIEEFISRERLDNVLLVPFQPPGRLAESLSMGNVHFVSLMPGFEGLEVPSKAYGSLAVARPMIYQGSPFGEIARMIMEHGIGSVVEPGDPDKLMETILGYYHDPVKVDAQGKLAIDRLQTDYSAEAALNKYWQLII